MRGLEAGHSRFTKMIDHFSHGMANIVLLWWYFKDVKKYCKSISSLQDHLRFSTIAIEGKFYDIVYHFFFFAFFYHFKLYRLLSLPFCQNHVFLHSDTPFQVVFTFFEESFRVRLFSSLSMNIISKMLAYPTDATASS